MMIRNYSHWIAVICVIIGIAGIGASFYIKNKVAVELSQIKKISPLSRVNPLAGIGGKIAEATAQGKAEPYLKTAEHLLIWGVVLIVVGGVAFLIIKRKD